MAANTRITDLDLSKPFFLVKMERVKGSDAGRYFWSPNMFQGEEAQSGYGIQENTYITRIRVRSSFDPPINKCDINFNNMVGHTLDVLPGDRFEVFLGYYNDRSPGIPDYAKVFTGYVAEADVGLDRCRVTCISKLSALISLRRHMVLNRDTVNNVIRKLVEESEDIRINEISTSDIQKSRYVFSDSENLYENIRDLSIQAGLDLYMDVHDKLIVKAWEPRPPTPGDQGPEAVYPDTLEESSTKQYVHRFYFGLNIMDIDIMMKRTNVNSFEVRSFSSYGEENECQYSIDNKGIKKEFSNENGYHFPRFDMVYDLPFTPRDSAEKIMDNLRRSCDSRLGGSLKVVGSPHVRLNDGVRLAGKFFGKLPMGNVSSSGSPWDATYDDGTPGKDEGGEKVFQVIGVEHVFDFNRGFYSLLDLEERELPESEAKKWDETTDEKGTGEEKAEDMELEVELDGRSRIAPEFPQVAALEADRLIAAKDEFREKLDRLLNRSSGIGSERSEVAKEYLDIPQQQKNGMMKATEDFRRKLEKMKDAS